MPESELPCGHCLKLKGLEFHDPVRELLVQVRRPLDCFLQLCAEGFRRFFHFRSPLLKALDFVNAGRELLIQFRCPLASFGKLAI